MKTNTNRNQPNLAGHSFNHQTGLMDYHNEKGQHTHSVELATGEVFNAQDIPVAPDSNLKNYKVNGSSYCAHDYTQKSQPWSKDGFAIVIAKK